MNIFYLSRDPFKAAKYQYNKHVVKMILESAQLLYTAHWVLGSDMPENAYRKTHENHPCAIWVRESEVNYDWLFSHLLGLLMEYERRYNKKHKTFNHVSFLMFPPPYISCVKKFTHPPLCMPDKYKTNDPVESYWNYYEGEKWKVKNKNEEIVKRSIYDE